MQKRKDEDKEPKNEEGREVWLDDTTISELSTTSYDEDDNDEEANENKE